MIFAEDQIGENPNNVNHEVISGASISRNLEIIVPCRYSRISPEGQGGRTLEKGSPYTHWSSYHREYYKCWVEVHIFGVSTEVCGYHPRIDVEGKEDLVWPLYLSFFFRGSLAALVLPFLQGIDHTTIFQCYGPFHSWLFFW